MESKYDPAGIQAASTAYANAAHTAQAVGARVRQLRQAQAEARAPVPVDLDGLQAELTRLAEQLAEDAKFLSGTAGNMGSVEQRILAMLAGALGPAAAMFLRLIKGKAKDMLSKHELADMAADLKYGASGAKVSALQRRLKAAGFDPGPLDGKYGPQTQKAIEAFQRANGLPVTGNLDGGTSDRLVNPARRPSTAPSSTPTPIGGGGGGSGGGSGGGGGGEPGVRAPGTAGDVLKMAESQLGEAEHPPGSNNTKYGSWYNARDPAEPWCARFVSWVYDKSGHPLPNIQDGKGFQYCPAAVTWAKQHGLWNAGTGGVQPGDVVMFDWNGDGKSDHTGIATSTAGADGSIRTIEGNAGNVVGRHTRGRGVVMGYFRP